MTLELNADAIQAMTPEQARAALPTAIAALTLLVAKVQENGSHTSSVAPERWVTTAEACSLLGITRQTLLRYKARGMLHAAKIGRGDRYSTRELDALPEIIQKGPWK